MGRPRKNNAEYYTHDSGMRNDVKIKALRRKFSHTGYAVWNYLLEALTDSDDFRIEWNDVNRELYAADFDVTDEELSAIVDYCMKIDLLQMDGGCIMSDTLCGRFNTLIYKRSRDREPVSERKSGENSEECMNTGNKTEFFGISDSENSEKPTENSEKPTENSEECIGNPPKTPKKTAKLSLKPSFSGFPPRGEKSREEERKEEESREENISSSRMREETVQVSEEEKRIFFEIFFFRNFQDPAREVERFIAWNGKQSNRPTRYDAELWNPEVKDRRFSEGFLKAWKVLYTTAKFSGPDGEEAAFQMMDSRLSIKPLNGKWQLQCPEKVAVWLNDNQVTVAEILKPALRGHPLSIKTYRT